MNKQKTAILLLRWGVAFSFIYAAVSAFLNPTNWIGFIPDYLTLGFDKFLLLKIHSVIDLLLGAWLLWGRKVFDAAVVSSFILFAIIVFNLGSMEIVFRDVSILLAAVALAVMSYEKKT